MTNTKDIPYGTRVKACYENKIENGTIINNDIGGYHQIHRVLIQWDSINIARWMRSDLLKKYSEDIPNMRDDQSWISGVYFTK
tara:strand:+ start:137 stop:385 length:249 start_codon:yes stop_codon:yes gene_type:complete